MASKTVTAKEMCRLLGGSGNEPVSESALGQFVKQGMPKPTRGQYDPLTCMYWYIGHRRRQGKRQVVTMEDGQETNKEAVEIRLTAAKADNEEMTAKERRGELIPLNLHRAEQAKLIIFVKQRLLNLPARLAPKLEGLNRMELKALLSSSVKAALVDLARGPADDSGPDARPAESPSARTVAARVRPARSRTARKSRGRKQRDL